VGAYRDTDIGPADPLGLLRADLAQAGLVRHRALGPLAAEEAAALLDDLLATGAGGDRAVRARVLERAGGVPFFLVSYAQALQQGGAEAADAVPWDVSQGVRQRAALLPHAAQVLLGVGAVVGRRMPLTLLAAVAETGGVFFALGLLTPFAALGFASVMVVAVGAVHWRNGFWVTNGGFEFNLALWTAAVAVTAAGPGRFSLDRALGWDGSLSGLWWGVGVALVSLAGGALVLATREVQPEPEALEQPLAREVEEERAVH
jgi:uncharacterized membrane protein YphA (DoxX/SURF4 family)